MKKYVVLVLLFAVPWIFNAAMVADEIIPVKVIDGGYRVDFTNPTVWKNYVRPSSNGEAAINYINANFMVDGLRGLGSLIECVPRTIREGKVSPFQSCSGIAFQKGAKSLTIRGSSSNIYGLSATIVSPAANNPNFSEPYTTGFGFQVLYDYEQETNINQRPKCVAQGGTLQMINDTVGAVEALPAAKQIITLQCTHPITTFTFKEEGYYFHELSHPQFIGYYETTNVGPLVQSIDFFTKKPFEAALKLNTLSKDGKKTVATNLLKDPDGYTLKMPLGTYSSFALVDSSTGASLPARYSYSTGVVLSPSIPSADLKISMHADRVAYFFGNSSTVNQTFISLHMGQQKVLVTPDDTRYSPFTVILYVVKPVLAADEVDPNCTYVNNNVVYDAQWVSCLELIYSIAHKTGIPVPMIKAQMEQETGFSFKKVVKSVLKKDYYRYEPAFDRTYFYGMSPRVNYKDAYINVPAYKPWLFLAGSTKVYTKLLHLRAKYKVLNNGKYESVPDNYEKRTKTYTALLAWDIVDADINHFGDSQHFLDKVVSPTGVVEFKPAPTAANFNFVAQTTVSASYGMMQVMYPTAISQGFKVNGVGDDPWKLFYPSVSLGLGSKHLLTKYKDANISRNTSAMGSLDYYLTNFRFGYVLYNGSATNKRARDYGVSVLNRADKYFSVEKIVYAK